MIAVAVLVTQVTSPVGERQGGREAGRGPRDRRSRCTGTTLRAGAGGERARNEPALGAALQHGRSGADREHGRAAGGGRAGSSRSSSASRAAGGWRRSDGPAPSPPTGSTSADPSGSVGSLAVSTTTAPELSRRGAPSDRARRRAARRRRAGLRDADVKGASLPASGHSGDVEVAGRQRFAPRTTDLPGPGSLQLCPVRPDGVGRLLLLEPAGRRGAGGVLRGRPGLRGHASARARRAGARRCSTRRGESARVTSATRCRWSESDEMAGLASEFNKMSDRLSAQMDELRRQQVEIDRSVRRIGEAFASGPRSPGSAQGGRRDGAGGVRRRVRDDRAERPRRGGGRGGGAVGGDPGRRRRRRGGGAARDDERRRGAATTASALWRARSGRMGEPPANVGVMTVARRGEPFTAARARGLPLPRRPGVVVDREHRPARAGLASRRSPMSSPGSPTTGASAS